MLLQDKWRNKVYYEGLAGEGTIGFLSTKQEIYCSQRMILVDCIFPEKM